MNKTGLVAAIVVAACLAAPVPAQQATNLSIVTGGTGGVYYPLGGGLANVLSKYVPGWQATAEGTGGAGGNFNFIGTRWWVGGRPTAAVTDLAATPNTKIRMVDTADLVSKMNEKYGPIYSAGT